MSDKVVSSSSSGIGFFGLLAILFIALKLTHYIDWSWWLILMPIYLPLAIGLSIILIVFLIALSK